MKEYRKTATVKAKVFEEGDEDGFVHTDGYYGMMEDAHYGINPRLSPFIKTLENQNHKGEFGKHYLCVGIKGEKWLVEKEIFESTYQEVVTSSQTEIKDNKIMLLEEDLWCVHKYLDYLNIERNDGDGKQYSIVGRIKLLEDRFLYQMSELETNLSTSQIEISDEEIEERAERNINPFSFIDGAKWYREQLKKKQ